MKTNFKEMLEDERPYWKVIVSLVFSLIGTVLFIVIGYKMIIFFMPFAIGWLISVIATPVVNLLENEVKIVRKLGSAIIIVAVLAGIVLILYLIGHKLWREIAAFTNNMPAMYRDLESGFSKIATETQGILSLFPDGLRNGIGTMFMNIDQTVEDIIGKFSTPTVEVAGNIARKIPAAFIGTIVAFISAYFFTADREEVLTWAKRVTPDPIVRRMTMVCDNLKYAVGGYFKAQFKIMAVVFVMLIIGFMIMGVNFVFLLALITAFLDFLPFFGTGTVLLPWALYKFLVGDYKMLIALLVLYGVTQLVRQLIQPKLVGDSMGLNPLFTLFLLYIGYRVGGLFGMIFAVPAGLIVINLYKAGAFDYILDDVKVLMEGILSLREKKS